MAQEKKIVDVPVIGDSRFKQWTKVVTGVDKNQQNGYAFRGHFLKDKAELPIGTFILAYGESGSMKYHDPMVKLYKVDTDGLSVAYEKSELSRKWALDVRDDIAELVNAAEPHNPLANYSDDDIREEAKRRGIL